MKSLIFGHPKTVKRTETGRLREGKAKLSTGGTVKYWELYGMKNALGIGLSTNIIDVRVPDGHCAELYALGCKIASAMGTAARKTKDIEIGFDSGKLTGIKFGISNYAFSCYAGVLAWGDYLNPPLLLDYPARKGNLTVKFNEGQDMEIVLSADTVAIDQAVYAKAKVLLYEEADVGAIYGVGISNFATLEGGVSQSLPYRLFAEYAYNPTSAGDAKWVEYYSKRVMDYEEVKISHLGSYAVLATNFDALRLYDYRTKKEFPEYEPYWKINRAYNMLPMGGDITYVPTQKLPNQIADYVWNNTTLYIYFKDIGAAVAALDGGIQLLGTYRRVR